MSVFFQPIASTTVGAGGAANITFSNINQGYQDLYVMVSARNSVNDRNIYCTMNNDGSNSNNTGYYDNGLLGSGSVPTPFQIINDTIFRMPGATASSDTANTFGVGSMYIANYASGSFKSAWATGAANNNSTAQFGNSVGWQGQAWNKSAPVTTLSFTSAGTFVQNTTITLYGVSNVYDTATPAAPTIGAVTDLAGDVQVAFTANDSGRADSYYVESPTAGLRTYGTSSPIVVTGVTKDVSLQYTASAVNSLGTSTSSNSASITTVNDYAAIATITGAGGSFVNIPQYYRHLQVRIFGRATTGLASAPILFYINGYTNTSYVWHQLYGDGSSTAGGGLTAQSQIEIIYVTGAGASANFYGAAVIDILDYTATNKFKTVRALGGFDVNASGLVGITSGYYPTLEPVTSIGVSSYGGFDANTIIALYGIG